MNGAFAGAAYLLALFCVAVFLGKNHALAEKQALLVRVLFLLAAIASGISGARGADGGRILCALAGESALLLICIVSSAISGSKLLSGASAWNLALLLIGAFAGIMPKRKHAIKQRGIPIYRK